MTDFTNLKHNITQKIKLTDDEFDLFCSKIKLKQVKKKQPILIQGETCKYASFVNKGAGRGYLLNDKNEEKTILLGVEDWWLVDFYSYITNTPSRMTIEAVEDCELFQMTFTDLEKLIENIPSIERFIRLMAMNAFVSSQSRLMDLMTNTTDHRYEIFLQKYPHFLQRFPQYIIASYLNVSPEHLSTVRAKLAKK
jgi:CRP-like cAMP-binding protein